MLGLVKSSELLTTDIMLQRPVQASRPKGLTCPHSKDYHEADANNLQKELPRIPRAAMFEDFKAFKKAGLVLVDLHVNYEQMQAYAGCTVSGLKTDADDFLVTSSKELKGNRGDRRDRGARKNIGAAIMIAPLSSKLIYLTDAGHFRISQLRVTLNLEAIHALC